MNNENLFVALLFYGQLLRVVLIMVDMVTTLILSVIKLYG